MDNRTKYRIYPDGEVVHQDDFAEKDSDHQPFDDFEVISLPNELVEYIENASNKYKELIKWKLTTYA